MTDFSGMGSGERIADPMPKPNIIIVIAVVLAIGSLITAAGIFNAGFKLDQIIAMQEAGRAFQKEKVAPQHEGILAAVREKCK
jgi:hypothetical protein